MTRSPSSWSRGGRIQHSPGELGHSWHSRHRPERRSRTWARLFWCFSTIFTLKIPLGSGNEGLLRFSCFCLCPALLASAEDLHQGRVTRTHPPWLFPSLLPSVLLWDALLVGFRTKSPLCLHTKGERETPEERPVCAAAVLTRAAPQSRAFPPCPQHLLLLESHPAPASLPAEVGVLFRADPFFF